MPPKLRMDLRPHIKSEVGILHSSSFVGKNVTPTSQIMMDDSRKQ